AAEGLLHGRPQPGEPLRGWAVLQEIEQPPLVYRDEPDLVALQPRDDWATERLEELGQDGVAFRVPLVLGAVVVGLITQPLVLPEGAVPRGEFPHRRTTLPEQLLDLLNKGSLSVPSVARDDHEAKVAVGDRRRQLVVEASADVSQPADLVEP